MRTPAEILKSLSHTRLTQVLRYCKTTGQFTWRVCPSNRVRVDDEAGVLAHGYRVISIDGEKYCAHHLAIFYVTGSWPVETVDHKNTDRSDNRIRNLRVAGHLVNAQNRRSASRNNKTGVLGVALCKSTKKFRAQIMVNRKKKHLGRFETVALAQAAYLDAKRLFHEGNTL